MLLTASFPGVSLFQTHQDVSLHIDKASEYLFIIAYILIWLFSLVHIKQMFTMQLALLSILTSASLTTVFNAQCLICNDAMTSIYSN